MAKITIPTSMLKKLLAQNDMRVGPEAVARFKTIFVSWAAEISKNASAKAKEAKRKTILVEDLQ